MLSGIVPIKVFYSYAHEDQDLRDALAKHLQELKRQGLIVDWHDRCISAGNEWKAQIDEHLESAELILLLISPDFVNSDYCYDLELKRAMERHEAGEARVVPVHLRKVFWRGAPFAKLQALPKDAKPVKSWSDSDEAFYDVAKGLRTVAEKLRATLPAPSTQPGPSVDPTARRNAYLALKAQEWRSLRLSALDPVAADPHTYCPMTLEQVYVSLDTTTPRPAKPRRKQDPEGDALEREPQPRLSAVEALWQAHEGHMVLLGQPGSGKSTFARHVAIGMARVLLGAGTLRKQLPGWKGRKALLPVFVPLGRLAVSFPKHAETGSADWVAAFIRDQVNGRQELAGYGDGLLHQLADAGGLVIFDGLDEVPGQQRKPVKEAVQGFAALHRSCKILVTCRIHSYRKDAGWDLDWPAVHELAPLSDEKIDGFIEGWYQAMGAIEPGVDYGDKTDKLKSVLVPEDPRKLRELARNPLLLTVMAVVHTYQTELLESRVEVYRECVDILLLRWHTKRTPGTAAKSLQEELREVGVNVGRLNSGLLELAYRAHKAEERKQLSGEGRALVSEQLLRGVMGEYLGEEGLRRFLGYCQHANGLLLAEGVVKPADAVQGWRVYAFPHLSFEEYLAALYLKQLELSQAAELAGDPAWREVIRFLGESFCFGREMKNIGFAYALLEELCPEQVPEGDPRSGVGVFPEGEPAAGLPQMAWVPIAATEGFRMGSGAGSDPKSSSENEVWPEEAEPVRIEAFYLAAYPVTVAQFRAFVAAGTYREDRYWTRAGREYHRDDEAPVYWNDSKWHLDNHPVIGVSWYEAVACCRWLNERLREAGMLPKGYVLRLPTEAEWEWAARGPEGRRWPWGDEWNEGRCNSQESKLGRTTAVGAFPAGACVGWWDPSTALPELKPCLEVVHDLAGNVWEWCSTTWQDKYPLPDLATEWSDEYLEGKDWRVLRGGSWIFDRSGCRGAARYRFIPDGRTTPTGDFGVVLPRLLLGFLIPDFCFLFSGVILYLRSLPRAGVVRGTENPSLNQTMKRYKN